VIALGGSAPHDQGGACLRGGARLRGFGQRLPQMHTWLGENCGADGWMITPSGMRGVLSGAVSIYFADPPLAAAFVARWWVGSRLVETTGDVFQVREDEPATQVEAKLRSAP
jgi:hypothetical protein